ncbi:MAG: CRISPR-associated endonuclease Cas2 [Planctomycetes bacterium]|nr:CRISPR-associated endonuclease Cas2 [Planctomycetota bacterium]
MRTLYIVTYDVCDDKRLRRVFKTMRGYGDHLQDSVFRCELSERERIELVERLTREVKHDEDQVLFFPLGPAGGVHEQGVSYVGRSYSPSLKVAVVV